MREGRHGQDTISVLVSNNPPAHRHMPLVQGPDGTCTLGDVALPRSCTSFEGAVALLASADYGIVSSQRLRRPIPSSTGVAEIDLAVDEGGGEEDFDI